MLFTYALDACVFICSIVAFDFEHTTKNFSCFWSKTRRQSALYFFILTLCLLEIVNDK